MTPVIVDTNIILDIVTDQPGWVDWSIEHVDRLRREVRRLLIVPVIYGELSAAYESQPALDRALTELDLGYEETGKPAIFRAGHAFRQYRRRGGQRTSLLPDFFIGAHAQEHRYVVLTRDTGRYRTYFPDVPLITPEPGGYRR